MAFVCGTGNARLNDETRHGVCDCVRAIVVVRPPPLIETDHLPTHYARKRTEQNHS